MTKEITLSPSPALQLASPFTPTPKTAKRVLGEPALVYDRRQDEISLDEMERISI